MFCLYIYKDKGENKYRIVRKGKYYGVYEGMELASMVLKGLEDCNFNMSKTDLYWLKVECILKLKHKDDE